MSDRQILGIGSGVWRDLYAFVYRNLRKQGLSHADAEDLAQDILETTYLNIETVEPSRRNAWLMAVIHNKIVDRARRSGRVHSLAELPDSADPALGPDEIAVQSADRQLLMWAISQLPERDQHLVEVRYLEERSIVETAQEMGMSVGAAKVALHRARERLRAQLQMGPAGLAARRGEPMTGIAERTVFALTPYIGRVAADTTVRGTAVSIGKTFDTLGDEDASAIEHRVRLVLAPLLPPDTIARLITDIRGGAL